MKEEDLPESRSVMSDQPPIGEVRLIRYNDGRLEVESATSTVWFAQHSLDMIKAEPDPEPGWAFDGSLVTLDVSNGRWIWKLTGRSWCHEYGPGTTPLVTLEARWPD